LSRDGAASRPKSEACLDAVLALFDDEASGCGERFSAMPKASSVDEFTRNIAARVVEHVQEMV